MFDLGSQAAPNLSSRETKIAPIYSRIHCIHTDTEEGIQYTCSHNEGSIFGVPLSTRWKKPRAIWCRRHLFLRAFYLSSVSFQTKGVTATAARDKEDDDDDFLGQFMSGQSGEEGGSFRESSKKENLRVSESSKNCTFHPLFFRCLS